jgi:hypothetical protein
MILRHVGLTLLLVVTAVSAHARQVQEVGFSVTIPDDWKTQKYDQGHVVASSPDGSRFAFVRPILGRTADCGSLLRSAFSSSWPAFPGARGVEVGIVPGSRNLQVARFVFGDGKSRGQVLCAETSARTAMYYGVAAPVQSFNAEAQGLVAILKSFRYGGTGPSPGGQAGGSVTLPPMVAWQEPNERAYTLQVPQGWRISGGLARIDVTHASSGVDFASPDGAMLARMGDGRLRQCTVPGPAMPQGPSGLVLCPYQTGRQAGESYLRQTLVREWGLERLQITSVQDRQDLSAAADRGPAQFGLNVRNAFAELHFQASRRGQPVEGMLLANTQMMASVSGQNFMLGTYTIDVNGYAGPAAQNPLLAAILGHVGASMRWNIDWWQREQRISRDLAERTLAMIRAQGENQQKAFWDRMAASDRRREGVNDILGGTVRLSDGQGNTYQAQAGSNYYFFDQDTARRASKPNDAVVGTDVYPAPLVDLRPLEVIR